MGKGAILSGLLHLAVLLLAVFGLPWLYDTSEVLQATPVSVISEAQFAELKNQRPPAQQRSRSPRTRNSSCTQVARCGAARTRARAPARA